MGHSWMTNDGKRFFKRNMIIPKWLVPNAITTFKNSGVFVTAYAYDQVQQDEATLYGNFYLDFDINDIQNGFESIRKDALYAIAYITNGYKIEMEDIQIYFSGKKGLHVIIPKESFGFEPNTKLNVIFKELAVKIKAYTINKTIDTQIYDNKRIFRYPGSIHESTGLHKISLTFEELKKLSISEIEILAKESRVFNYREPKQSTHAKQEFYRLQEEVMAKINKPIAAGGIDKIGVLRSTPPCIQNLIDNGATEGSRNNTLAVLVSFYKRKGMSYDEVVKELEVWNSNLISPIGSHEFNASIKSVYQIDKIYGCTALKTISVCNEKECQLKRGKS